MIILLQLSRRNFKRHQFNVMIMVEGVILQEIVLSQQTYKYWANTGVYCILNIYNNNNNIYYL